MFSTNNHDEVLATQIYDGLGTIYCNMSHAKTNQNVTFVIGPKGKRTLESTELSFHKDFQNGKFSIDNMNKPSPVKNKPYTRAITNTNNAWGFGGAITTTDTYPNDYIHEKKKYCYRHMNPTIKHTYTDNNGTQITKAIFQQNT